MTAKSENASVKPSIGAFLEQQKLANVRADLPQEPSFNALLLRIVVALESLAESHREEIRLAKKMTGAALGEESDDED